MSGRDTLEQKCINAIRQLLRRISMLAYFHCDNDTVSWDFEGCIDRAEEIATKKMNPRR